MPVGAHHRAVFLRAWKDPIGQRWMFAYGIVACGLVIPYAFIMNAARGLPSGWAWIDAAFGLGGAIPLLFCWTWTTRLEAPSRTSILR